LSSQAIVQTNQLMQLPWLYDLQLLLHTEASCFSDDGANAPYLVVLLELASSLPLALLSAGRLQRLEAHAAGTVEAWCGGHAKVAQAAEAAMSAIQAARAQAEGEGSGANELGDARNAGEENLEVCLLSVMYRERGKVRKDGWL
jgi:hypothetical protein